MTVAEGQVLARLDVSNVEASLKLAEAQLEVTRTAVEETKVRLHEAQLELGRIANLVRDGVSTQSALDAAQAEADSLQARLARQSEEIKVAERQITLWKQELEDRVIRAPFAGVVVSKDAQPGEMISPVSAGGGFTRTGICTIVDMGSLEVEVDVNESYINRVQPGQPVEATLDAYTDWKIPCKVIAIIPTADRQKATVKVRIGFDQLDPRVLPDMGVKVAFRDVGQENQSAQRSVLIPKAAARREGSQDVVFVLSNGQVERRAVTLGEDAAGEVAVLAGIKAGDRVVINGPEGLADGKRAVEKNK
jgi:HlyD family secretion protein